MDPSRRIANRRAVNKVPGSGDKPLVAGIRKAVAGTAPSGLLARVMKSWCSQWGVPNLVDVVSFRTNKRLRSSIARWVVAEQRIEIAPLFFSAAVNHREVLCHELAHAAVSLKHGRRVQAHGPEWRELVRAAGLIPRSRLLQRPSPGRVSAETRSAKLYEHRCPVCQSV